MAQVERRVQKGRGGKPGPVRWRVRYISPDGRERNKTFLRKVGAARFAATVEVDKSRGEWIDPRLGRTIVEDWAEGWMAQLVHVRPKTLVGYDSFVRTCVLPTFGKLPLAKVEQPAVAAWVAKLRARGLSASRIRQAVWDDAVAATGLSPAVTPHCLRHTCASLLIAAGADPVAVQRHLGHKDVTTTLNIYAGLFPNRLDEIVVALDAIHDGTRAVGANGLR